MPSNTLSDAELGDHYRLVANEILAGRVVPFLGAGANLCGRPEEVTWRPGQFDWLPSGAELSRYLAEMFNYSGKNEDDLVRVSQYVSLTVGAYPLYYELRRLFDGDYPPTALHSFLAKLPATLRGYRPEAPPYQLIVTTNYDDVLERAFRQAGEPFDLVTYDAEGSTGASSPTAPTRRSRARSSSRTPTTTWSPTSSAWSSRSTARSTATTRAATAT